MTLVLFLLLLAIFFEHCGEGGVSDLKNEKKENRKKVLMLFLFLDSNPGPSGNRLRRGVYQHSPPSAAAAEARSLWLQEETEGQK